MRVSARMRQERGAVAVMVALSLVVLLGMLALVIDLGRAVGVRREMVNAADAAALAAAQRCAFGQGPVAATAAADATARANVGGAERVGIEIDPECASGPVTTEPKAVTVTYSEQVDYFVAPILGFDDVTVTTSATAIWGAASRAAPIPLRINLGSLAGCGIDAGAVPAGQTCYLGYANNDPYEAANDWGWLYFGGQAGRGWNTTSCESQGGGSNDPISFISGQPFFNALLNDPPPTYACSYSGNPQNVVRALAGRVGDVLTFPVVDAVTYPVVGRGANLAWPVVAFIGLRLDAVYDQPGASTYCPELEDQPGQDEFCLRLSYVGTVPGGQVPGSAIYFNVPAVRLVE